MMEGLVYATEMNSKGAALLEAGNDAVALECFKESLEALSYVASFCGKVDASKSAEANDDEAMLKAEDPALSAAGAPPAEGPSSEPQVQVQSGASAARHDQPGTISGSPGPNHFIYVKPFTFTISRNAVMNPAHMSFYISIIEFNMALTLHILSSRLGEKFSFSAVHVYDCCLGHLRDSGCSEESAKIILFAALNNKGAILYDLSDFQMAQAVLTALLDAIHACKKTGLLFTINDDDLEGFLFNVMLLRGATIAPAA